jgi:hypothetical protein
VIAGRIARCKQNVSARPDTSSQSDHFTAATVPVVDPAGLSVYHPASSPGGVAVSAESLAPKGPKFREPGAAQAGGYVLVVACVMVAVALLFHPPPAGGFEEKPSVLQNTPWWGPIHIAIAAGFVLCVLGGLLMMFGGGPLMRPWLAALSWASITVGMVFFSGVALINGWVMHFLSDHGAPDKDPMLYDAFNRLLIAYGWLGNPLFLVGLCGVAFIEVWRAPFRLPRWLAWAGLVCAVLSWGRGVGSASGMYFLEPLIFANVPAFLWLGYYGLRIAAFASRQVAEEEAQPSAGGV